MRVKITDKQAIIRIDKGESVIESLIRACNEYGIKAAAVSGIGATDSFLCGVFEPMTKDYKELKFDGCYEILSLCGNISEKDGEPYVHVHICASDDKGSCVGGHLKEARVSVTCEIVLSLIDCVINRKFNEQIGINLLDI